MFLIFISVLLVHVGSKDVGVDIFESTLAGILFADDLVLFGDDPKMLPWSLAGLEEFCYLRKLEVNSVKSRVMIFGV